MAQSMIPVGSVPFAAEMRMSGEFSDRMHVLASEALDSMELRRKAALAAGQAFERVIREHPHLAAVSVTCRPS